MSSPLDQQERQKQWRSLASTQSFVVGVGCDLLSEPCEEALGPMDRRRLSQLLPGEAVGVLEEWNGWVQVAAFYQPHWQEHAGEFTPYKGWVRQGGLVRAPSGSVASVCCQGALVKTGPAESADTLFEPVMGSLLYLHQSQAHQGWYQVRGPGQEGWICGQQVRLLEESTGAAKTSCELLRLARSLRSAKYLYGGLGIDGRGFDCSGLVHLLARCMGHIVARDAKDQYRWLVAKRASQLKAADLVFWSPKGFDGIDHVAIVGEDGRLIESTAHKGGFHEGDLADRLQVCAEQLQQPCWQLASKSGSTLFFAGLDLDGR